jgi:hypothetical protein
MQSSTDEFNDNFFYNDEEEKDENYVRGTINGINKI